MILWYFMINHSADIAMKYQMGRAQQPLLQYVVWWIRE